MPVIPHATSPYDDFPDYVLEPQTFGIQEGCGKAEEGKFELEYGKEIVARATFYFMIRYPGIIDNKLVNLKVLLDFHQEFPVSCMKNTVTLLPMTYKETEIHLLIFQSLQKNG